MVRGRPQCRGRKLSAVSNGSARSHTEGNNSLFDLPPGFCVEVARDKTAKLKWPLFISRLEAFWRNSLGAAEGTYGL